MKGATYRLLRRYSNFADLQRSVSWLLRYHCFLKHKTNQEFPAPPRSFLNLEEMRKAKLAFVRAVQREVFPKVMDVLYNHPDFNCTNALLTDEKIQSHPSLPDLRMLCPYHLNGIL